MNFLAEINWPKYFPFMLVITLKLSVSIIFNPLGCNIDKTFSSNYIYYHDWTLNNGQISQILKEENWQDIGIPYIAIYKFIDL